MSVLENRNVLCLIMGGGRGTRMQPLTEYRSKPAVPLGGRYRLIDVPISNCLNSGFNKILVLTQYNSESLNKHIFRTYKLDTFFRGFVEVLAAEQSHKQTEWFQGTADSVRRSLPHIRDPYIDEVIVLSGDQLFNMDLRDLQRVHRESGAEITIACHPEPADQTPHFGIMNVDANKRITSFVEKPKDITKTGVLPVDVNGKPRYLASMGIYIFNKKVLTDLLTHNADMDDFGKEIIPAAIGKYQTGAYVFDGYWSDIGSIGSYYEASLMLTTEKPEFDLYNEEWPVYTRPRYLAAAKIMKATIDHSMIAEGSWIQEAEVIRSIIGLRSRIGKGTRIEESIINGNDYYQMIDPHGPAATRKQLVGIGSHCLIRKAIVDKNVSIGDNVKIINKDNLQTADGPNYSIRDGIVVVHKSAVIANGTVI